MSPVFAARSLPNFITGFRFLLIAPVVVCLLHQEYFWALGLFALAAVSDGLDGFLARQYAWHSRLGTYLDPLADKALITSVYVTMGWQDLLPPWLVALVILRDVVILGGAFLIRRQLLATGVKPSLLSKVNTAAQILLVLVVMGIQAIQGAWPLAISALIGLVAITTVASGFGYIIAGLASTAGRLSKRT